MSEKEEYFLNNSKMNGIKISISDENCIFLIECVDIDYDDHSVSRICKVIHRELTLEMTHYELELLSNLLIKIVPTIEEGLDKRLQEKLKK